MRRCARPLRAASLTSGALPAKLSTVSETSPALFSGEFDQAPGLLYLNSGTHSLTPRSVLDAITRYEREYETNPTAQLMRAWGRLWAVQKRLGAFFRADPRCLLLRQNVTEAMNAFILGIPLSMGSEILLSDLEYQAVENIGRYRAERDGLTLRKFHLPVPETGRMSAQEIADLVSRELRPETGLLVLSHVFTGNARAGSPARRRRRPCRRRAGLRLRRLGKSGFLWVEPA